VKIYARDAPSYAGKGKNKALPPGIPPNPITCPEAPRSNNNILINLTGLDKTLLVRYNIGRY